MKEFDFFIGTFSDAVEKINHWLGNRPTDELIHFNDIAWQGDVLLSEFEAGCYVRAWNFTLKENTRFRIRALPNPDLHLLMINYLMMPESFIIETNGGWPEKMKKVNELHSIVFSNNNNDFSFIVKAGQKAKALDICFTEQWLFQQFPHEINKQLEAALTVNTHRKPLLVQAFSINDHRVVNEILEKVTSKSLHSIFLKSRVLTLLSELMDNFITKDKKTEVVRNSANADAIIGVEKKIGSLLHEKFPKLKDLAKEFSLSESTLKRQFKNVFGKGVYEYYLEKKMELAKKMIVEKNMTTSQVAYSLGYEKASPFIKIFKRVHGVSPGSLRFSKNTNETIDQN
ncbi:MAG: helix-turn-helix transcriptional regulator [Chitinophagaceae bacterium]